MITGYDRIAKAAIAQVGLALALYALAPGWLGASIIAFRIIARAFFTGKSQGRHCCRQGRSGSSHHQGFKKVATFTIKHNFYYQTSKVPGLFCTQQFNEIHIVFAQRQVQ